jgi:hypothetical protein
MVEKVESRKAGVPDDIHGLKLLPPARSAKGERGSLLSSIMSPPSRMGIEANVDEADNAGEGCELLETVEKRLLLAAWVSGLRPGISVADSDCDMNGFEVR